MHMMTELAASFALLIISFYAGIQGLALVIEPRNRTRRKVKFGLILMAAALAGLLTFAFVGRDAH